MPILTLNMYTILKNNFLSLMFKHTNTGGANKYVKQINLYTHAPENHTHTSKHLL